MIAVGTESRTLVAKFDGDARGLEAATLKAERQLARFKASADRAAGGGKGGKSGLSGMGSASESLSGSLGKLAVKGGLVVGSIIGIGAVAATAAEGLFSMGQDALNLGLQTAKARIVFDKEFPKIEAWAKKGANAMGLTTTEAEGLAAGIADFLVPMGATRKKAADMSMSFGDLAGKLSLWSMGTMSSTDVMNVFQGALAGEYDSLQRLGININAAKVDQEALSIAHARGSKKVSDLDRAQAILNITTANSKDASKIAESAEGKKAKAFEATKAKVREQWQEIEKKLLPIFETLMDTISKPGGAIDQLKNFAGYLASPDGQKAIQQWATIIGHLADMLNGMATAALAVIEAINKPVNGYPVGGGRGGTLPQRPAVRAPGSGAASRASGNFSGLGGWDAAFAMGGGGSTQAARQPIVNVDSRVYLDGQVISAIARTSVSDSASRSAWRARNGRR